MCKCLNIKAKSQLKLEKKKTEFIYPETITEMPKLKLALHCCLIYFPFAAQFYCVWLFRAPSLSPSLIYFCDNHTLATFHQWKKEKHNLKTIFVLNKPRKEGAGWQ